MNHSVGSIGQNASYIHAGSTLHLVWLYYPLSVNYMFANGHMIPWMSFKLDFWKPLTYFPSKVERLEDKHEAMRKEKKELHDRNIGVREDGRYLCTIYI